MGAAVAVSVALAVVVGIGVLVNVADGVGVDAGVVAVAVADAVAVVVSVDVAVRVGVAVGVTVGLGVGVRVEVAVRVAVGVGATSTEPTSNAVPCGRVTPRWSVEGAPLLVPLSIAGLSACGRCVCVDPPLLASGPSFTLTLSRPAPKPQVLSEERLKVALSGALKNVQLSLAGLLAMMTFSRERWVFVPLLKIPPPSAGAAVFPNSVTLVNAAVPSSFLRPPP